MSDLQKATLLIAQARADSYRRQYEETTKFFEVACEVAEFWRSLAPEGAEYPPELQAKIDALLPTTVGKSPDSLAIS